MKKYLLFTLFFIYNSFAWAQTDNDFWFVAPEVTSSHGDSPVVLRLATENQASIITITQPANIGFVPIVVNIAPNTSQNVDLTPFISTIENSPVDVVNNYGIRIQSTTNITAYYEVNTSCQCNSEIFVLKGRNALGIDFYLPFQTGFNNGVYTPPANSGMEIVATQNNTVITITPSQNAINHPAGVPFQVTLNQGQTYSVLASSLLGAQHLAGTRVTSTKPIAITIKDDSGIKSGCRDLMGDQIVPVDVIGNEYIIIRGDLNDEDRVYVLATQNNTTLTLNGTPVGVTLAAGQTHELLIDNPNNDINYLVTSAPTYVLQVTGTGCELSHALLPPIICTGSNNVFFVRSVNETFQMNVFTRVGNEGGFVLNGSTTLLTAADFLPVPGTGGQWLAARKQFNTTDVPVNVANSLTNTLGRFHMGFTLGGASTSSRYGYFSDYRFFSFPTDIVSLCQGTNTVLDAGAGFDTYLWSNNSTTQITQISTPGEYWVTVTKDGCTASDTVDVSLFPPINLVIPNDTICAGTTTTLDAGAGYDTYNWNNGASTNQTFTTGPGTYTLLVTDTNQCQSAPISFTILQENLNPVIDSVGSCGPDFNATLVGPVGYTNYTWQPGNLTGQTANVSGLGQYSVTVTSPLGCTYTSNLASVYSLEPLAGFNININSTALPNVVSDTVIINTPVFFSDSSLANNSQIISWQYLFHDGTVVNDSLAQFTYPDSGFYQVSLIVVNADGCIDTLTTLIWVIELPIATYNFFSPNGDAINETLIFSNLEQYPGSKIKIFNRWGNLVYQNNDYKNDWSATDQSEGVYFYILEVNNPAKQIVNSTVTIMR